VATVAGIVLAAGSSLRMGEPKQLLRYRGRTLLNHVIATAEASRLDHVVVVIGANAQAIEDSIESERATVVHNPEFQLPNMASVVRGASAVDAEAFLTLPADMPEITTEVIDAVLDWWIAETPWAAMTEYLDRAGHPFLLSRAALDEAAQVEGPNVLWRMLAYDGSGRVTRITVARPAPRDVNTPEDYEELTSGQ
jgi:molybdenum cofactor cytidylyltransferase